MMVSLFGPGEVVRVGVPADAQHLRLRREAVGAIISSAASTTTPAPSERTKPLRSALKGREACAGRR